jgi:hypothetical protein
MLIPRDTLDQIARGEITMAFRRWQRPTVKTGGTLLTRAGQLEIKSVDKIEAGDLRENEARRAGFNSREELIAELDRRGKEGEIYRIAFGALTADPRIALRAAPPDEKQIATLRGKLARLDAASPVGAWTRKTLEVIRDHPAVRAGDICKLVGQDRAAFKPNVRKLKALGLTISLEVGYRLSPRGEELLRRLGVKG